MSRSTHPARRAVIVVASALVAALAACRDSVAPSPSLGVMTPYYDFELGAAIGDTLDLTGQMLVTGINEEISCHTDNGLVVETVAGTGSLIALGLGDALISCAVLRRDDSSQETQNLEMTAAVYNVYLRVR
jgi:hypothetical protein